MTIIWQQNWEGVALTDEITGTYGNDVAQIRKSGNAPTISDEQANGGTKSMKMFLDFDNAPVQSYRTELQLEGFANFTDTWKYSFDIFLPDDYPADPVAYEAICQLHGTPDGTEDFRSPPASIETAEGRWSFKRRWDSRAVSPPGGSFEGVIEYILGDYAADQGKWTKWEIEIFFSWTSTGLTTVKKNGKIVYYIEGPNTYNDTVAPYFKAGTYKDWRIAPSGSVRTRTLYFDNFLVETL